MFIWIVLLLVLAFSLEYGINNFGNIGFSEIVFTLNMPMKGADSQYLKKYVVEAIIPILIGTVFGFFY